MKIDSRPYADDARLAFALAIAALVAEVSWEMLRPRPAKEPLRFERHFVDLNSAKAGEIEALPGVGPVLARRIVAARAERRFASADELGRVPGVGPTTIERLRGFVRCGGE